MTPYDPLSSLEAEVERFMRTNTFTPMEVTGFYIHARCVATELRSLREENKYLRNARDRQAAMIRKLESDIIEAEDGLIALEQKATSTVPRVSDQHSSDSGSVSIDGTQHTNPTADSPNPVLGDNNRNTQPP